MQTPYEILQLKQKQKRKIITELKKQRSCSFRFYKNGLNPHNQSNQKQRPHTHNRYQRNTTQRDDNKSCSTSQKKYQIVFRESIRKVNAYRTKIYHTHTALKKQHFVNRFIGTPNNDSSEKLSNYVQNLGTIEANKDIPVKVKILNPQKQAQSLNVGKYRIFFKINSQKGNQNQIIPEISVQKCKLNLNDNDYKQKIQKTIQSLYNHNKKMENTLRKCSIDSFTDRENTSQESYRKNYSFNGNDTLEHTRQFQKSPRSTIEIKNQIKHLKQQEGLMHMLNPALEKMDQTKVANFIRSKKKKRLPISIIKTSKFNGNGQDQFRRTITDNLSSNSPKHNFLKNIQQRYYSPNKQSRCGARIKFNSIEQNISGWQFQSFQNSTLHHEVKTPLLDY